MSATAWTRQRCHLDAFALHDGPTEGDRVSTREVESYLRNAPRQTVERVIDFLTTGFGWCPRDFDRHACAIRRVCELIDDGRVSAVRAVLSGSSVGSVPFEEETRPLSELVEESDDEVSADVSIESPVIIETAWSVEPPSMADFDVEFEEPAAPQPLDPSAISEDEDAYWVQVVDTEGTVFVGSPITLEFAEGSSLDGVLDEDSGLPLDLLERGQGDAVTLVFPQGLFASP